MTLNEIAYNLLNLVRGGRSNHDEHISLDQIKLTFQNRLSKKGSFVLKKEQTDDDNVKINMERKF